MDKQERENAVSQWILCGMVKIHESEGAEDMTDQEKREKLIDGLGAIVNDDWMWREADYYASICEDALTLLKAQEPREGTTVDWISVEDRLPEGANNTYLCCLENGEICILGYNDVQTIRCPKGFYYYDDRSGMYRRKTANHVTHWMPMPKPPKEG